MFKNYTADGIPIYKYPYKILNPIQGPNVIEKFTSNNLSSYNIYFIMAIILLIVIIIYYYTRK